MEGGGYFKRRSHVLKIAPNQGGGVYKLGKVFKPNRTVHSLYVYLLKKKQFAEIVIENY